MNRIDKIKVIRQTLANDLPSIGSWMQLPDASVAEIMGDAGYDWVAIDLEHGAINNQSLPNLFRALELGDTLPLVRLAQGCQKECKQALDAGAGGVIIPMVHSAKQLADIKDYCCWPPSGERGVAFSRANLFGKYFSEYNEEAQSPILVAMIEHISALDNLDDILKVKGLDAILIGPYDLSASMNRVGEFDTNEFIDVINKIKSTAIKYKIPCGIHIVEPDKNELIKKIDEGYCFIAYSIDTVFLNKNCLKPDI